MFSGHNNKLYVSVNQIFCTRMDFTAFSGGVQQASVYKAKLYLASQGYSVP